MEDKSWSPPKNFVNETWGLQAYSGGKQWNENFIADDIFSDKRKTDQIIHELDGNRRMADRITQRVFSSEEHLGAEVTILITCLFLERMRCLGDILYLLYIFLFVCLVMDSSSRPGPL